MAADVGGETNFIFLSTVKVNGEEAEKHQFTERDTPKALMMITPLPNGRQSRHCIIFQILRDWR